MTAQPARTSRTRTPRRLRTGLVLILLGVGCGSALPQPAFAHPTAIVGHKHIQMDPRGPNWGCTPGTCTPHGSTQSGNKGIQMDPHGPPWNCTPGTCAPHGSAHGGVTRLHPPGPCLHARQAAIAVGACSAIDLAGE